MNLTISIDVEEDNWGSYTTNSHTLRNISRIPKLQDLFDSFGVIPTYLLTYPIAVDSNCIALFREIEKLGRCELGMHCHPWNTPPHEEELSEKNSMLCNLPEDLQFKKIKCLYDTIENNFGTAPISFRAGRFGYGKTVAENLLKIGCRVDTSITPYTNWQHVDGPDFSNIGPHSFRFSCDDIYHESNSGPLFEVPVTVGFLQSNYEFSGKLLRIITAPALRKFRMYGILQKLHLLNRVWLCPEGYDAPQMIALTKTLLAKKFSTINMFFHSSTLMAGLTPFVKTEQDENEFLKRISDYLVFCKETGITSKKIKETAPFKI